jgi:hypothetical protein
LYHHQHHRYYQYQYHNQNHHHHHHHYYYYYYCCFLIHYIYCVFLNLELSTGRVILILSVTLVTSIMGRLVRTPSGTPDNLIEVFCCFPQAR